MPKSIVVSLGSSTIPPEAGEISTLETTEHITTVMTTLLIKLVITAAKATMIISAPTALILPRIGVGAPSKAAVMPRSSPCHKFADSHRNRTYENTVAGNTLGDAIFNGQNGLASDGHCTQHCHTCYDRRGGTKFRGDRQFSGKQSRQQPGKDDRRNYRQGNPLLPPDSALFRQMQESWFSIFNRNSFLEHHMSTKNAAANRMVPAGNPILRYSMTLTDPPNSAS